MAGATKRWTPILTEREAVLFDLKGFILFPAVLSADEIAPIEAQCEKLRADKASLPQKRGVGGRSGCERSQRGIWTIAYQSRPKSRISYNPANPLAIRAFSTSRLAYNHRGQPRRR